MSISGAWYGFCLTLFVDSVIDAEKSKDSVRPVSFAIKALLIILLAGVGISLPRLFHLFSNTIVSLIELNTCVIFIILMMTSISKEILEIKKINKKIKEKNKN